MSRIAVLHSPRSLQMKDRNPLKAESNEVIIEVELAGICGTDLALYSGDYQATLPLVLGHEFVGRVSAIGQNVDVSWLNQRVTAEINNSCLALRSETLCRACRVGLGNHCLKRTVTGIIGHPGAFADEIRVPAGTLHKVPDSLNSLTAVLTEPLAAAIQTFETILEKRPQTVAVLGPGRLGILIVFVAALRGHRVMAVSQSELKQTRALDYGAEQACKSEDALSLAQEFTQGLGLDIMVDATGCPKGIQQALQLVRPCGTVAVKTTCGLPAQSIDLTRVVVDEIRIQGSRCGPFSAALELLNKNQVQLKNLITSIQPLDNCRTALESAFSEPKVVLKTKP